MADIETIRLLQNSSQESAHTKRQRENWRLKWTYLFSSAHRI